MINTYKDVPGVLMFLLGNENNYGLEWQSFEIENLPKEEQHKEKGRYLYQAFAKAVQEGNALTALPIGVVNGDLLYIDLIADIFLILTFSQLMYTEDTGLTTQAMSILVLSLKK